MLSFNKVHQFKLVIDIKWCRAKSQILKQVQDLFKNKRL